MIARWMLSGDPAGLIRYVSYDAPTASDPRPDTTDRVRGFWTIAAGTGEPEQAIAEIEGLIADAPELKAASGISGRGRKSTKSMGHLIIAWEPGAVVTEGHAFEIGRKAISAVGLTGHIGVMALHADKAHPHLHIAICRIDPESGRTINTRNPAQSMSAFAREYERQTRVVVPRREGIAQARERALAAEQGSAEQRQALELEGQLRRGRQRRRGPGRPRRPRWERREWAAGRQAGVADAVTKKKIELRRVERRGVLRDRVDQRAVERAVVRSWPTVHAGQLSRVATELAEGRDDVARIGAAACDRLARRRPITPAVFAVPPRLRTTVRRAVEDALRARGHAVIASTAAATPAAKPQRTPPKPERGGLSR